VCVKTGKKIEHSTFEEQKIVFVPLCAI